ncbi:MAG TPA: hypothetical protein VFI91_13280 [Longimicrobiaceae bacterium]|nr:hypothetical protein [Longimicrobiaceae bacterium]
MSLLQLRPRVQANVRDSAGVLADSADYNRALIDAVQRYSRVRPRRVVADIEGDGGFDYPLPAQWSPRASRITSVEYPAGERLPRYVDRLDWTVYAVPDGEMIRFFAHMPQAGETIRVSFRAPHTISESATTVPAADHDVIVLLASAAACEQLASHYSNSGDSTIMADSVDHQSKARDFAMRAKRFHALADDLIPEDIGEVSAAGGTTSWGGHADLMTHPRR